MNTGIVLMVIYVIVTAIFQTICFGLSLLVDLYSPTWSLLAFLVLFLSAFWVAWPVAVIVTNWLIPMSETEKAAAAGTIQGVVTARKAFDQP